MADKSTPAAPLSAPSSLPPVLVGKVPTSGNRVPVPARQAPARTVFDTAPVAVSATRKQADDTRRKMASAVQSLRNAMGDVSLAQPLVAADAAAAAIFAQDGIGADVLKQFADLAAPILSAFTAPVG